MLLIFIIITIITIYVIFKLLYNMTYQQSSLDNNKYYVRNLQDKLDASNIIAQIRLNILILTKHLYENRKKENYIKYEEYIIRLHDKIKYTIFNETSDWDIGNTSYSIEKGKKLVFCLRSVKNKDKFHDMNLLMYVVLHEISHIACPEKGHGDLFKSIFAFITNVAVDINLYKKISFETEPKEYCGLIIDQSII